MATAYTRYKQWLETTPAGTEAEFCRYMQEPTARDCTVEEAAKLEAVTRDTALVARVKPRWQDEGFGSPLTEADIARTDPRMQQIALLNGEVEAFVMSARQQVNILRDDPKAAVPKLADFLAKVPATPTPEPETPAEQPAEA